MFDLRESGVVGAGFFEDPGEQQIVPLLNLPVQESGKGEGGDKGDKGDKGEGGDKGDKGDKGE